MCRPTWRLSRWVPGLLAVVGIAAAACGDPVPAEGDAGPDVAGFDYSLVGDLAEGGDSAPDTDATPDTAAPDIGGELPPVQCTPNATICLSLIQPGVCAPLGNAWIEGEPCLEGQTCHQATGECGPTVCEPTSSVCLDSLTRQTCHFDGSGWDPEVTCPEGWVCSNGHCISANCLPRVMFLMDRSTSMSGPWDSVQASIVDTIELNPEVQFGLTVFPSEEGFFAGCTTGTDSPAIPLQDNAGPLIDQWFEDHGPAGATPLEGAMEWMSQNVAAVWGDNTASAYLILLSDGEDKCTCQLYDDDPEARAECVAEKLIPLTQSLTAQGVKTIVIGYAYSGPDIELAVIAENGGTEFTDWLYAGSEESLTAVFGQVIDDIKWCL